MGQELPWSHTWLPDSPFAKWEKAFDTCTLSPVHTTAFESQLNYTGRHMQSGRVWHSQPAQQGIPTCPTDFSSLTCYSSSRLFQGPVSSYLPYFPYMDLHRR